MKNKTKIRIKGVLRTYLNVSVYLGILLAMTNLAIYLIDYRAGLVLSCFVLLYFAITMYLYLRNKSVVLNELVSFATEYGQIQRQLLRELELPYALLDDNGKIIWTNKMFEQTIQKEKGFSKPISSIFPEVNVHKLLADALPQPLRRDGCRHRHGSAALHAVRGHDRRREHRFQE